ncbi:nucleotide exchange factor GrpE [Streptomyces chattanoogensis]|uniref:nucleotide exchange factor GrpE n=1 Tax=Streptomyces chattanoogensis TaxID=66876 RepID=UPI0036B5AA90
MEVPGGRPAPATGDEKEQLRARLAECTDDLKRLKAEYDNYRKRVSRDRLAGREITVAGVLRELLPVLDAIGRAREHGEVTGGFEAVAKTLEDRLATLGLQAFGAVGDAFDPALHEAVTHTGTDGTERPTCAEIVRPGYRVGEYLLRPAQVAVAQPTTAEP